MTKERDAAAAARKAYLTGVGMGPAGIVLGPVFAAAAFASVMAFEGGGVVPGVGRGDIVPAMLEPGEGIVPGSVMDNLKNMAASGGGGPQYHAHVRPTYHISAIDTAGVEGMLAKHSQSISKHVNNELRKMNR